MNKMIAYKGTFGKEYTSLSISEQALVREDYEWAFSEDRCSIVEYARRIGKGNLCAYVACLKVSK